MEITNLFKDAVVKELLAQRDNFGGSDAQFARSMDINPSVFSRLQKGEREKLLSNSDWLRLGRELRVSLSDRKWNPVETDVFMQIREEVLFCKQHSKSRIFVDNCGIGKTFTLKYLSKTVKNCFYVDCTQCKTKNELIKALARAVGVELKGKIYEIKENTKYYLSLLDEPVVELDEAGALEKDALGLVQEYWNATEGFCGWYMVGANALRNKIAKGVSKDKDYFAELFSRFSENFSSIVPTEKYEKYSFYEKLIRDVLSANITDKIQLNTLVKKSLVDINGSISGLRRAESLLILHNA
ncbi:AAA family ATPase [Dysgonomonas reticulitermitis]